MQRYLLGLPLRSSLGLPLASVKCSFHNPWQISRNWRTPFFIVQHYLTRLNLSLTCHRRSEGTYKTHGLVRQILKVILSSNLRINLSVHDWICLFGLDIEICNSCIPGWGVFISRLIASFGTIFYTHTHTHTHIHIYIYIYIYTVRTSQ
jgi:hypothetical protein